MAEVIPFRGILYNTSKVSGEEVVAPPYDIIAPEYKEELYRKSPYNIVRIDFGKELEGDNESENRYTRAAGYFDSWLEDGILLRSQAPGFYAYEINYRVKNQPKKLRGFFGLVRLEELGKGSIYPHECTHSKPKADRLNVMRACNANISPIFSLYNSPEKKASGVIEKITKQGKPYMEAKDLNGAIHRLWIIETNSDIEVIKNDLKDRAIFIADGHHRYETALEFQKEKNSELRTPNSKLKPWNYVLMFLANMSDEGITILPTHRLVRGMPDNAMTLLSGYFDIKEVDEKEDIEQVISGYRNAIGLCRCDGSRQYVLVYKEKGLEDIHPSLKGLDVIILHELIFKKLLNIAEVVYEMDVKTSLDMIKKGLYDAAFFLNPTKVEDVEKVALSSMRMPPKSTYFYPKLLTGMVMNKFQ